MSHLQNAFSPAAAKEHFSEPEKRQNVWMSKRKIMCWACQKEYLPSEGKISFQISLKGFPRATAFSSGATSNRKFVCFNCKPEVK